MKGRKKNPKSNKKAGVKASVVKQHPRGRGRPKSIPQVNSASLNLEEEQSVLSERDPVGISNNNAIKFEFNEEITEAGIPPPQFPLTSTPAGAAGKLLIRPATFNYAKKVFIKVELSDEKSDEVPPGDDEEPGLETILDRKSLDKGQGQEAAANGTAPSCTNSVAYKPPGSADEKLLSTATPSVKICGTMNTLAAACNICGADFPEESPATKLLQYQLQLERATVAEVRRSIHMSDDMNQLLMKENRELKSRNMNSQEAEKQKVFHQNQYADTIRKMEEKAVKQARELEMDRGKLARENERLKRKLGIITNKRKRVQANLVNYRRLIRVMTALNSPKVKTEILSALKETNSTVLNLFAKVFEDDENDTKNEDAGPDFCNAVLESIVTKRGGGVSDSEKDAGMKVFYQCLSSQQQQKIEPACVKSGVGDRSLEELNLIADVVPVPTLQLTTLSPHQQHGSIKQDVEQMFDDEIPEEDIESDEKDSDESESGSDKNSGTVSSAFSRSENDASESSNRSVADIAGDLELSESEDDINNQ